jgi:uncharacterized membrane protein YhaH (DUF805 family)
LIRGTSARNDPFIAAFERATVQLLGDDMDFGYLYTNFEGRIGRKSYWLGTICLIIVMMIVMFGAIYLIGGSVLANDFQTRLVTFVLQLLFLYPSAALIVKRLHDRNRPGWFAAFMLGPVILKSISDLVGMTGDPINQNALDYLFNILIFVVAIWFFVELGCLRGTVGPNQYGPDPVGGAPAPAR